MTRSILTWLIVLTSGCSAEAVLHTDRAQYAASTDGVQVRLVLTAGIQAITTNLCFAQLQQLAPDGTWGAANAKQTDSTTHFEVSCPALAMTVGAYGTLTYVMHHGADLPGGTYRYVLAVETGKSSSEPDEDVVSNTFEVAAAAP